MSFGSLVAGDPQAVTPLVPTDCRTGGAHPTSVPIGLRIGELSLGLTEDDGQRTQDSMDLLPSGFRALVGHHHRGSLGLIRLG